MRTLLATLCLAALSATLVAGAAVAKSTPPPTPPKGLHGFLLRPTEPRATVFPRTPAFAWSPVRGANCYEFELGTSQTFSESSIIWSNVRYGVKPGTGCATVPIGTSADTASGSTQQTGTSTSGTGQSSASTPSTATPTGSDPNVSTQIPPLRVPAVSVDVALPWFTGQPYALYAHVRAITKHGPTGWSTPFAFNMRWPSVPSPLTPQPGLVRWSPIPGATGYQIWYTDIGKVISTHTNVADEREFYSFHNSSAWWSTVHWRVRAVRRVFGDIPNGLPAVSYGPWSSVYTATNPDPSAGQLTPLLAVSDRVSDGAKQSAHELMPALSYSGNTSLTGQSYGLFRAYAFTDHDCVNVVYQGSVVGGPAFAPRTTGPLKLPASDKDLTNAQTGILADAKAEPPSFMADGTPITASESAGQASTTTDTSGSTSGSGTSTAVDPTQGAHVDLPDIDFPTTRYYWTVVPVALVVTSDGVYQYWDTELPQDACAAGRIESFGKESEPVVAAASTPYVAGLSPNGRELTSVGKTPTVYSTPLVAWQPATGATAYEIQWSRTKYPWRAQGRKLTYSTSAILDLTPGKWYYRIRGLNQTQLKKPEMSWSTSLPITIAKPTFKLVHASK